MSLFQKTWIAYLGLTLSPLVSLACPPLSEHFTAAELKSFQKAKSLISYDAIKTGEHEYALEVLYSQANQKFLVLLGEVHLKTEQAAAIGKEVLSHFKLRGVELVPKNESKRMSSGFDIVLYLSKFFAKHQGRKATSSIFTAISDSVFLTTDHHVFRRGKVVDAVCSLTEFKEWTERYASQTPVTVGLERAWFLDIKRFEQGPLGIPSNEYIIDLRNERMENNILAMLHLFHEPKMIVVTGMYHTPGIMNDLIRRFPGETFERCDLNSELKKLSI